MPRMSARVLVTGAGVTGGEVLRRLAASNLAARALVRDPERTRPFTNIGVELIEGDFARPEILEARSRWRREGLFHYACTPRCGELERHFFRGRKGGRRRASRKTVGHKRIVVIGSRIPSSDGSL